MKQCTYCGKEYDDKVSTCVIDGHLVRETVPLLQTTTSLPRNLKTSTLLFAVANLVGMVFILCFCASSANLAKMERRDYYDGIDGVTLFFQVVPVLLLCLLLNLAWGIKALIDFLRRKDFHASYVLIFVAAAWLILFVIIRVIMQLPPDK
jgi:hypothetical protein